METFSFLFLFLFLFRLAILSRKRHCLFPSPNPPTHPFASSPSRTARRNSGRRDRPVVGIKILSITLIPGHRPPRLPLVLPLPSSSSSHSPSHPPLRLRPSLPHPTPHTTPLSPSRRRRRNRSSLRPDPIILAGRNHLGGFS